MAAPLVNYIIDTSAKDLQGLAAGYNVTGRAQLQEEVRNDQNLAFSLQPVVPNPSGGTPVYIPDHESTDTHVVALGLADQDATGGTFKLTVNGSSTGMTVLAYNITAADLQTPVSAAFVAAGKAACTVTLIEAGVYRILGNANGAVATGILVGFGANLTPVCDVIVTEKSLGSASLPYEFYIVIRQSPVALSFPTTQLAAASISVTSIQAGSSSADKIQQATFGVDETYTGTFQVVATAGRQIIVSSASVANPSIITTATPHGFITGQTVTFAGVTSTPTINGNRVVTVATATTFSIPVNVTVAGYGGTVALYQVATCGIAKPGMTLEEFSTLLANHPQIDYQNQNGAPDSVIVTLNGPNYQVHFTGALGLTDSNTISVANIDLLAPKGVSGTINLNTVELYLYSLTQTGQTFTLTLSVQRTRASGEVRTILLISQTLGRDIIDVTSMIPAPRPRYLQAVLVSHTPGNGNDTGTFDLTFIGLTSAPSAVVFQSISKSAAGQSNIFGQCISSGITTTAAPYELNAASDSAGRVAYALVYP